MFAVTVCVISFLGVVTGEVIEDEDITDQKFKRFYYDLYDTINSESEEDAEDTEDWNEFDHFDDEYYYDESANNDYSHENLVAQEPVETADTPREDPLMVLSKLLSQMGFSLDDSALLQSMKDDEQERLTEKTNSLQQDPVLVLSKLLFHISQLPYH